MRIQCRTVEEDLKTKEEWESWWGKVNRKALPKHHVDLDDP